MSACPVPLGREVEFTKTISESDVYLYAGITGDFSPNHVNQTYMERSAWGKRMAHGMLLLGFVSTTSTMPSRIHAAIQRKRPWRLGWTKSVS